jgi:hypothetical protein
MAWEGLVSNKNRSWLSLLGFCLTCVLASALAVAVVLAGVTLVLAIGQSTFEAAASTLPTQTLSGVISDSNCGARHNPALGKSPAECTRACVRRGASYVLVDGDQTYVLRGKPSAFDRLAGQRVQVIGALDGDTVRVKSIAAQ